MEPSERQSLVDRYTRGHAVVVAALAGITDAELDAPSSEGWTAREVVHHLADSEMTSAIRIRRLLAEDNPVIVGYDEEQFARVLHYAERPIDAALEALAAARRTTAEILARLSDAEWSRHGTHTAIGSFGVEDWLVMYAAHAHDHAAQIGRARGRKA